MMCHPSSSPTCSTCAHVIPVPAHRRADLPASVHQATRSAHNPESYRGVSTCHRRYAGQSRGRTCACRRGGGGRTCTHVMSAPTARPAQQIWRLPASVHQATRSAHNPESYRGVSTCHRCYAGESRGRACACRRGRGTCAHVIRPHVRSWLASAVV
jgi:hypothetical protein